MPRCTDGHRSGGGGGASHAKAIVPGSGLLTLDDPIFHLSPPAIRGSLVCESPAMESPDLSTWVLDLEPDCPTVP